MPPTASEPQKSRQDCRETEACVYSDATHHAFAIDQKRYHKVRRFFFRVLFHLLFWDILFAYPVLRIFRTAPLARWQQLARDYRKLAVEMGGVLIKLGQFLSIRVDILPPEVTLELAGLQDNVPAEPTDAIIKQIETDFCRPVSEIFADFKYEPLGAASLAQVHQVVLPSGNSAVAKVLRPKIHILVETDLAAIRKAVGWLKLYKRVRERVDLDWLIDEFTTVTRKELDLVAEGKNAEQLNETFSKNPHVYIPKIFWDFCSPHTLTMEKVDFFKIDDLEAIEKSGISGVQVADKLYRIYMEQVFETFFVHVDPHPGNLFVKPLPTIEESKAGVVEFKPDDPVSYQSGRPFQIVFVDFGMAVTIPERLRTSLRDYVIGLGTKDAHKMVQAYINAGALSAHEKNVERIEEAHEALFDRLWGVRVGQFRSLAVSEAKFFLKEYRDVIYDAPFQFQADMLFVMRAVGILSGLATHLDPDFDPWTKTIPYAERFAKDKLNQGWMGWQQEVETIVYHVLDLPGQLDRVLTLARQGKISVRNSFSSDTKKQIHQLEKSIRWLGWMVMSSGFLIAGILYQMQKPESELGWALLGCALLAFLLGIKKNLS
jgi:predicted unusual protein kinase regulating ubiquinone biosynthesis (AarF/ABC1/UbiB family)